MVSFGSPSLVDTPSNNIQALVSVYQKLLEFYVSAYDFLSKRRTRLVLAVIADTGTLPDIVKDFLKQAEHLRKLVEKATFDIVQDIKTMLYDEKSMSSCFQS
jgi:hypothetical protein